MNILFIYPQNAVQISSNEMVIIPFQVWWTSWHMDHGNSVATMPFSYKRVVKIWILFQTGPDHKHPDDLNKLGTFADTIKFMVGIGNNIVYKIYIQ